MKRESEAEHLFVYGTLRRGADHPMAALLAEASTHMGTGSFQGRLFRVSWYPCAVPSHRPEDRVVGDVFRLHPSRAGELLQVLDEYEGTASEGDRPAYYRRERVRIQSAAGELEAWIYLFNRRTDRFERIDSGDFLAR